MNKTLIIGILAIFIPFYTRAMETTVRRAHALSNQLITPTENTSAVVNNTHNEIILTGSEPIDTYIIYEKDKITIKAILTVHRFKKSFENPEAVSYTITLATSHDSPIVGQLDFFYKPRAQEIWVSYFKVNPDFRRKNYGRMLLAYLGIKALELNCVKIEVRAAPFALPYGTSPESMLPTLIRYYQKFGAEIISDSLHTADTINMNVNFSDHIKIKNRIENILKQL